MQRYPEYARLSQQERTVLRLIGSGLTMPQIAYTLRISEKTLEQHRMHISDKLGIRRIDGLAAYWRKIDDEGGDVEKPVE